MRQFLIGAMTVLVTGALALAWQTRARAWDVPTTNTLSYSGTLYAFGAPDNASHSFVVSLFVPPSTTAACTAAATATTVNGEFAVPLPSSCVTVIHQNPNVQVQLTVDTTTLGATSLSAVPYAVEADTASNAAPGSTLASFQVPTGTVLDFAGGTPPTGFLACDGSAVSRATYATLFAAIGTTFGAGDGSTTFNLPDSRGRVTMGAGSGPGLTARALGQTLGEENHVLAVNEMPSHQHNTAINTPSNAGGSIYGAVALQNGNTMWGGSAGNANYIQETSATGGGAGHNTIPPAIVFARIIKT